MHHWKRWIGTGLQEYDDNNPMLQSIYILPWQKKYTKIIVHIQAAASVVKHQQKNSSKGSASLREDLSWSWKVVKIPAIFVSTFQLSLHTTCENTCQGYGSQKWIPASMTWKPGSLRLFLPGASPLLGIKTWPWLGFFRSRLSPYFTALKGMENASGESIFQASHRWMPLNICQLLTIL